MEPPQNFTAACEVSSQNDARYIWYKHPLIKKTKKTKHFWGFQSER